MICNEFNEIPCVLGPAERTFNPVEADHPHFLMCSRIFYHAVYLAVGLSPLYDFALVGFLFIASKPE